MAACFDQAFDMDDLSANIHAIQRVPTREGRPSSFLSALSSIQFRRIVAPSSVRRPVNITHHVTLHSAPRGVQIVRFTQDS
jgi:hypothetical protein